VEGVSTPTKRSERIVLEAYLDYWDKARPPRLQRIIFDNTRSYTEALELVKTGEGRVDMVTELSPLETLRVAQSPFAKVAKNRGTLTTMFGFFNMRKTGSPWHDIRLRQAVNVAINREDFIRYATKGNGVIIPGLVPAQGFGHDPGLAPYPFDPTTTRRLLREAGHADGLTVTLIATEDLAVQATVISKMLEQAGFSVDLQVLDAAAYNRQTFLSDLDKPPEQQPWDIALATWLDFLNFPVFEVYHHFALDGVYDWLSEQPELRQLYERLLATVDGEQQRQLLHQMERHTREQAYFLFLYNPIGLYAVNKAVEFVPYIHVLKFAETAVTEEHWSVRKRKAAVQD
jgi:ABC-type transport system substrate-binding protein